MLPRLIEQLCWADERTRESLATLPAPDPALQRLYAHILGAEAVWLARLAGRPETVTPWPDLDVAGCAALAGQNHAELRATSAALSPERLATVITYHNSKGIEFSNSVGDILHHVVMHGMYHRGQVAAGVRHGGGTPLPTDYIVFVREQ